MTDLIERARAEVDLRKLMFGEDRTKWSRADRMTEELLYALEAAREDGGRLDFLVDMWSRNLTPELAAVVEAFRDGDGANIRSAIDQARGKGGAG